MRRGRGKGKKQNVSTREDRESGEEEKIPTYRRRGRPQKPMKEFEDEEEEEEEEMVEKTEPEEEEEEEEEEVDDSITSKKQENERKRKMSNGEENNGLGMKSTSTGFRQNGSHRRKSKPRRAAEAVVECNGF